MRVLFLFNFDFIVVEVNSFISFQFQYFNRFLYLLLCDVLEWHDNFIYNILFFFFHILLHIIFIIKNCVIFFLLLLLRSTWNRFRAYFPILIYGKHIHFKTYLSSSTLSTIISPPHKFRKQSHRFTYSPPTPAGIGLNGMGWFHFKWNKKYKLKIENLSFNSCMHLFHIIIYRKHFTSVCAYSFPCGLSRII